jgi:acid phosphatase (class A)
MGNNMRKLAFLPMALCLLAAPALAISDKPYITAASVDFPGLLPPPPTEASPAGKRDLQTILDLQKNMTPERMAAIRRDVDQSVYTVAGPVLGPNFTKEKFPLAGEFFAKIVRDAGVGVGPIKQKYKKLRPFQYSKDVHTPEDIAKASGGPTYPSGHSTTGALIPIVLGMMVPEKREALYERGWEYGVNRVTSGAAYPSDWEGGHITASLAVHEMLKNPEFRADFEAVKAEIRKGLNLP